MADILTLQNRLNYVLLSGGIDSATVLAKLINAAKVCQGAQIVAVIIKYPSKHNAWERAAAKNIAKNYGVTSMEIDLTGVFDAFGSALLTNSSAEIPEGHYEAESMKATVVPLRNIIFSAIVAGKLTTVAGPMPFSLWLGVHAGDHAIYPDCRFGTIRSLAQCLFEGTDNQCLIQAPLINVDKTTIVNIGLEIDVPYELTRTCYTSRGLPCGKCGSCTERLEAFEKNGVTDPVTYQNSKG